MTSDSEEVFIGDLPAAVVLAALYNNAVVDGFDGRLAIDGRMSVEQAQSILNDRRRGTHIDKLNGRVLGIDFAVPSFSPQQYDDCNFGYGNAGTAARIVQHIRDTLTPQLLQEATKDFWTADGKKVLPMLTS